MFKKILSLALIACMLVACVAVFASCGEDEVNTYTPVAKADIKVGLICLHDENSTYDNNFIEAMKRTATALGLDYDKQIVIKTNVGENDDCYKAACELADDGCQIIFADSLGHEDFVMKAAAKYPTVQFCHATGNKAVISNLGNYHNAFAAIYQGRFVAGYIGGLKLAERYEAGELTAANFKDGKIITGYVGAFPNAEVVSGYTSYFIGVQMGFEAGCETLETAECPEVTMNVIYTNSWYDEAAEKEAANTLIKGGAALISQHADSMGAPTACETAGVPNVSYNGSTLKSCPKTFLVSSYIDWDAYYQAAITAVIAGRKVQDEYCGGFGEGAVKLTAINKDAFKNADIKDMLAMFEDASVLRTVDAEFVFDVDNFTVDGKKVTSVLADVVNDAAFTGDTEVILASIDDEETKYFSESSFRSAPYFELRIDGIKEQ